MAKGNLRACLDEVWPFEGGYVDHPKDPGGATNMGITFATLAQHRGRPVTKQDVRQLTKAEATEIYDKRYWRPLNGEALRNGDDLVVLDFGINSGISRSAKYTQAIVGTTQDGKIGPVTLAALAARCGRSIRSGRAGAQTFAFRQPAARASSSLQNQRSPFDVSIWVAW